jgi:glycosidase
MTRNPTLFQVNTRLFLNEVGQALGRPATFDDWPGAHLDQVAEQGFDWLWPLGVWQTGAASRQVSRTQPDWLAGFRRALPDLHEEDICGSPFAIKGYTAHTDFGGDNGLLRFRERCQRRGLRLLLDFVPNHTALDHPWIAEHPEYYLPGNEDDLAREPHNYARVPGGSTILAHGRDPYFPGWPDTFQLNYRHPGLRAAMIRVLVEVASRCDGVRCDMAMLVLPDVFQRTWGAKSDPSDGSVPVDVSFWPEALSRVRTHFKDFLFMAEVYWDLEYRLQTQGFDYTYDKRLYDRLRAHDTQAVRGHLHADLAFQAHSARFLENHDEERAAAVFPREVQQAAAMIAFLVPGLRFFHEGQFEGRRAHVSMHLGRRPVEPIDHLLETFYDELLYCLKRPELREGEWAMRPCRAAWDGNPTWENCLAFTWQRGSSLTLVCVNYGQTAGQCYVELNLPELRGKPVLLTDLLSPAHYERPGDELFRTGLYLDLPAWGYHLFEVKVETP